MEVFSRNLFRGIRKTRYVITLGPHAYYWFALHAPIEARRASKKHLVPIIKAPAQLDTLLGNSQREQLERDILPNHIQNSRWFGSKARSFRNLPRFDSKHNEINFAGFANVIRRVGRENGKVGITTIHLQPTCLDRTQVLATSNKRDILAGLRSAPQPKGWPAAGPSEKN